MVDEMRHIRFADWNATDVSRSSLISPALQNCITGQNLIVRLLQIEVLNKYLFLTSKPVIYLVNLSEKDYIRKKNKWYVYVAYTNALRKNVSWQTFTELCVL